MSDSGKTETPPIVTVVYELTYINADHVINLYVHICQRSAYVTPGTCLSVSFFCASHISINFTFVFYQDFSEKRENSEASVITIKAKVGIKFCRHSQIELRVSHTKTA